MLASTARLLYLLCTLCLMITAVAAPPARADEPPTPAKVSAPDVPGQVVIAPTRRQRERRALKALLTERNASLAALQARVDAAGPDEVPALQLELEQHKRATRLALVERQLDAARERGDHALVRRLDVQRLRLAAGVASPIAPLAREVAR